VEVPHRHPRLVCGIPARRRPRPEPPRRPDSHSPSTAAIPMAASRPCPSAQRRYPGRRVLARRRQMPARIRFWGIPAHHARTLV